MRPVASLRSKQLILNRSEPFYRHGRFLMHYLSVASFLPVISPLYMHLVLINRYANYKNAYVYITYLMFSVVWTRFWIISHASDIILRGLIAVWLMYGHSQPHSQLESRPMTRLQDFSRIWYVMPTC